MKVDLKHADDDKWPETDQEAADRASKYVDHDPLPDIPAALLGSASFIDYARITGMVYPFKGIKNKNIGNDIDDGLIKPASYEVRPGGSFFYFDIHGRRRENVLTDSKERVIELKANSITFCSTDEQFRLPSYIALRFNLRIKHVHRGILLGTGPLVDPGFRKQLLIPLHNLTDSDYYISLDEGLIWVEFTKTYQQTIKSSGKAKDVSLPSNTQKNFNEFFMQASGGQPIRSSIPTAIQKAEEKASRAIDRVELLGRRLNTISVIGIVAIGLALVSIIVPVIDLVRAVAEQVSRQNEPATPPPSAAPQ